MGRGMSKPLRAWRVPPYIGERYWEREAPQEADTARVALAYYLEAGKLQVSLLWVDSETGEKKRGKTVTLDREDFQANAEGLLFLTQVVEELGGIEVSNSRLESVVCDMCSEGPWSDDACDSAVASSITRKRWT